MVGHRDQEIRYSGVAREEAGEAPVRKVQGQFAEVGLSLVR